MDFGSALEGLMFGHKMRIESWPKANYIYISEGELKLHLGEPEDRVVEYVCAKDILSTSWEIV
jgi:hypothetical protein